MKGWDWLRQLFRRTQALPAARPEILPVLTLAYLGDAVYELYVRQRLIGQDGQKVHRLHSAATRYVCAQAQAVAMRELMDAITPEEKAVALRGRNARTGHVPKNTTPADYHLATGFEALVGYLYLTAAQERLRQVLDLAWAFTARSQQH